MEVLSFKLPVMGGNRIKLRATSRHTSSPRENERYGRIETMLARVAGESSAQKRGLHAHFEFLEALQSYRAKRRGYRVFVQALEKAKVRQFTVK